MIKIYLIISLLLLSWSCKPRVTHKFINTYNLESIRVDDDSEYHITISDSHSGRVISYSDLSINEYGIQIYYKGIINPIVEITYSDFCCEDYNYSKEGAIRVYLPYNYKINTFDD